VAAVTSATGHVAAVTQPRTSRRRHGFDDHGVEIVPLQGPETGRHEQPVGAPPGPCLAPPAGEKGRQEQGGELVDEHASDALW